jgi:hypothetical protein
VKAAALDLGDLNADRRGTGARGLEGLFALGEPHIHGDEMLIAILQRGTQLFGNVVEV